MPEPARPGWRPGAVSKRDVMHDNRLDRYGRTLATGVVALGLALAACGGGGGGGAVAAGSSSAREPAYPPAERIDAAPVDEPGRMPGYRSFRKFAGLATGVMRITDPTLGPGATFRHEYALRQPWNADGSRLLLVHSPVNLFDGTDFRPLGSIPVPGEPVWSNRDPDVIFGVSGNRFVRQHVGTHRQDVLRAFSQYSRISIGGGEGNLSDDDRFVALIGQRENGVDVFVYDIARDRAGPARRFDGYTGPWGDIDSAKISPAGDYVVVGMGARETGYDLYDRESMVFLRRLVDGKLSHGDVGWSSEGDEVLVTEGDAHQPTLHSIRLRDGMRREELPATHMAYNEHVSCRNNLRPGWCYVSTFAPEDTLSRDKFMYRQTYAIRLDGSGSVERFAPGTFAEDPADRRYERQAQAVPDRDGQRVLFASDWGDAAAGAPIHAYVAGVSLR